MPNLPHTTKSVQLAPDAHAILKACASKKQKRISEFASDHIRKTLAKQAPNLPAAPELSPPVKTQTTHSRPKMGRGGKPPKKR